MLRTQLMHFHASELPAHLGRQLRMVQSTLSPKQLAQFGLMFQVFRRHRLAHRPRLAELKHWVPQAFKAGRFSQHPEDFSSASFCSPVTEDLGSAGSAFSEDVDSAGTASSNSSLLNACSSSSGLAEKTTSAKIWLISVSLTSSMDLPTREQRPQLLLTQAVHPGAPKPPWHWLRQDRRAQEKPFPKHLAHLPLTRFPIKQRVTHDALPGPARHPRPQDSSKIWLS